MADPTDLNARWTDEQETALFKAIVRFKPVGMHKHFRMLAIRQSLLAQGVIDSHDGDQQTAANVLPDKLGADNAAIAADEHTSIPGIWAKLNSIYDLAGLDEREDAILDGGNGDEDAEEKGDVEYYRNFDLPDDEFGLMKDERRLNPDGSRSPSSDLREDGFLPEAPRSASMRNRTRGTDEDARSSSPAVAAAVSGRGGSARGGGRSRGRGARGGRVSRLRDEVEENGSRRTSRASNTPADDETVEEPDEDDGSGAGDVDETDEQSATESSVDQEEKRKVAPRRRGRRGGARGQQSRLSSGNARGSTKRARRK